MGEILVFPPRPATGDAANREGRSADILFFTGVRYERHGSNGANAPLDGGVSDGTPSKARRRKRRA